MYNPEAASFYNPNSTRLDTHEIPPQKQWNPYLDNGGTVLAVCGDDFVVIAGDTRLSYGYSIASRSVSKFIKLTDKCVLISSGMQSDMSTLYKTLKLLLTEYEFKHKKVPSLSAIQQFLTVILYGRRFFPYYAFNVLAGIDDDGKTKVLRYDAIGSSSVSNYATTGSGSIILSSILDNRLTQDNKQIPEPPLTKMEIIDLVKDGLTSVTERDVQTGDKAEIIVIDKSGFDVSYFSLKDD